jgi:hypothetical protein
MAEAESSTAAEPGKSAAAQSPVEAWAAFLESALQTARDMIAARPAKSGADEARIVRNCARMMRQAIDWEVECTDPHLPRLHPWEVLAVSGAPPGPNLDSPYTLARLDPAATYLLSGGTAGLMDVNVEVRRGFPPRDMEVFGDLGFADLQPSDGRWELIMGPAPIDDRPFLQFPEGGEALHLFMRLYWVDWSHPTRPVLEIECLDPGPGPAAELTPERLSAQLSAAGDYLAMRTAFQHDWFDWFFKSVGEPGSVPGGNGHVKYKGERYRIAPDEALIVEFDRPDARYWSVQLYDGLVYDCMDFLRNITIRNNFQADIDPDDRVRMVISHSDPGVRNWLDAGGVEEASWFYRAIWSNDNPVVSARKVKLADLVAALHAQTGHWTGEERAAERAMRRRKLSHHFFW